MLNICFSLTTSWCNSYFLCVCFSNRHFFFEGFNLSEQLLFLFTVDYLLLDGFSRCGIEPGVGSGVHWGRSI